MKRSIVLAVLGPALPLASCGGFEGRPPWADGRMVSIPRDPDAPPPDHRHLAERLLAVHNQERAALNIPPLVWDGRLAAAAASYGPALARIGKLEHSPAGSRPGQGENLWMGTHDAYRLEDMAGGWAAERRYFRPGTFPQVSSTGNWRDVAHYTQMIWRGTAQVGCALHVTASWDYLICRYAPPGNVTGRQVP